MEPVKLVSWNVNGLRAVAGKGFAQIFDELDADCVCLQETKLQKGQIDLEFLGYTSYWNYADKPGYSGTVIYTRKPVLSVSYGLGIDEHDHEGRVVTVEFEDFYLVNVYVPNSQDGLSRAGGYLRHSTTGQWSEPAMSLRISVEKMCSLRLSLTKK